MLIVKPYGRSEVTPSGTNVNRRTLRLRDRPDVEVDVEEFALGHEELVIAQWISVIDKIARKPAAGNPATPAQFMFRQKLGDAAWRILEEGGRLAGASNPAKRDHLLALWSWKIAPYGQTPFQRTRKGPEPSAKGRWFSRFSAGITDVSTVDPAAIAERIEEHLYGQGSSSGEAKSKKGGAIASRARSVALNVARPPTPSYGGGVGKAWSEQDEQAYAAAGNVAFAIRQAAEQREAGNNKRTPRRVSRDVAAELLYAQYGRLFVHPDGKAMSIVEARAARPGLFQLHEAIKDSYARLLDHRRHVRSKQAVLPEQPNPASLRLPPSMEALYVLVDSKGLNRDLNALVRLGKVIHFEAAGADFDGTPTAVRNWPASVAGSRYWTTPGQTHIKSSEAFVRIWRRMLSLAGRTLTDWADSKSTIGKDILGQTERDLALGSQFDVAAHERKLDLLLGRQASLFKFANDAEQRALLKFVLQAVSRLRNAAFHFTGFGRFAEEIASSCDDTTPSIDAALDELWEQDSAERSQLGLAIARTAGFDRFWREDQVARLLGAVAAAAADPAPLPLPRFTRVMKRAGDALHQLDTLASRLFMPTGVELRDAATYCRYEALKLLYDGPFRGWLQDGNSGFLNGLIDQAIARATAAARELNPRDDERLAQLVAARSSRLGHVHPEETIAQFFSRLSAESASEFRVQMAYQSDRDRARTQSDYIEKLKADMVALAFGAFLAENDYAFVADLLPGTPPADHPPFVLRGPPCSAGPASERWQRALYFLVHLVPVDDVVRLLHQVQRWEGSAGTHAPPATAQLRAVLSLYADMHDAKFEGGGFLQAEAFKEFYERPADFDRIFPVLGPEEQRLCRRGLREILRFGHLKPLRSIFGSEPVMKAHVEQYLAASAPDGRGGSRIARLQAEREALHALWVQKGRDFSGSERDRYRAVLNQVVRYRHLSAHVTFISHIRLHRLLVALCARLVDFSGLWERDLYFVTLAMIHLEGMTPQQALGGQGRRLLSRGQIIWALREAHERGVLPASIATMVSDHFSEVWKKASRAASIRNDIAHFKMLRQGGAPDMTLWVNSARELLRHDRKLRNAVPASIKELLRQNGLEIAWQLNEAGHRLGTSQLATRQAHHLKSATMLENLNGDDFVAMTAALFGSCRPVSPEQPRSRPQMQRTATRGQYGGR